MLLYPKKDNFYLDFNIMNLPDGNYLRLNSINESIEFNNVTTEIKGINIELLDSALNRIAKCTTIIGMEDEYISISSSASENEGKPVLLENIDSVTIEYKEV